MKNVIKFGAALAVFVAVGVGFAGRIGGNAESGRSIVSREAPMRPEKPKIFGFKGSKVEEARPLESFDAISFPGSGTLRIRIGAEPSVVVHADDRIIERVETSVRSGVLVLSERSFPFDSGVEYEVTVPSLRSLSLSGSGDVVAVDQLAGESLSIDILGSGNLEASVDINSLAVDIKGSGDVKLGGTADTADVRIFGSGDLKADELNGASVSVSVMGSGDTDLGAFEELNANIMGSGDVEYGGNPRLSAKTPGSGEVVRR